MSNREVRPPAVEDLNLVHNLIEQCIQLHLSKTDAVNLILREANIEPAFTELVWQKLEEENQEFFEAYYIQLALKEQIELFNQLLREQATLTQQFTNGVAPSPGSNGSHISGNGSHISGNGYHMPENGYHMPENGSHRPENGSHWPENGSHRPENGSYRAENGSHGPVNGPHGPVNGSHRPVNGSHGPENGCYRPVNRSHGPEYRSHIQHFERNIGHYSKDEAGPTTRSRNLQPVMPSNIHGAFTNGMSMLQMHTTFDVSTPSRGIGFLQNTLHIQSTGSTELVQGLNEEIIKSESDCSDSQTIFHTDCNAVGMHATIEGAPFGCMEVSSQILRESPLATNGSSFEHCGQISQNFSFSDLSAAYPNVLSNYANSSFGTTDADSFLVCQNAVEIPEDTNGRISDSYTSYEDLRSG